MDGFCVLIPLNNFHNLVVVVVLVGLVGLVGPVGGYLPGRVVYMWFVARLAAGALAAVAVVLLDQVVCIVAAPVVESVAVEVEQAVVPRP